MGFVSLIKDVTVMLSGSLSSPFCSKCTDTEKQKMFKNNETVPPLLLFNINPVPFYIDMMMIVRLPSLPYGRFRTYQIFKGNERSGPL